MILLKEEKKTRNMKRKEYTFYGDIHFHILNLIYA